CSGDQDVGGPGDGGQVDGVRVDDRNRGMVLKKKEGQGSPDKPRPAHNDGALAGWIDALAPEQLQDAEWRGRNEGRVALGEAAGVVRVEAVDIFMWWDLLERLFGIEVVREWHLDEDDVDRGVVGQGPDPFVQVGLRDVV